MAGPACSLLVAAVGGASLSRNVDGAPTATAEVGSRQALVGARTHGALRLIGEALGEVRLRPDQHSRVQQLIQDAELRHAETELAEKQLAQATAGQVERGHFDRAALQPFLEQLGDAAAKNQVADRDALEQLHAILGASQRAQFVDALRARIHGRASEGRQERAAHRESRETDHRFSKWAEDLELTDVQKARIRRALLARWGEHRGERLRAEQPFEEMRAKADDILEAFKGVRFAMNEVTQPIDVRARTAQVLTRKLDIVETVLPILTPDQRALAAAKIRAQAN
jgi:Spy/CpxP family protein refolding chaperone